MMKPELSNRGKGAAKNEVRKKDRAEVIDDLKERTDLLMTVWEDGRCGFSATPTVQGPSCASTRSTCVRGGQGWRSWVVVMVGEGGEFLMCWSEAGEEPLKPVKVEV